MFSQKWKWSVLPAGVNVALRVESLLCVKCSFGCPAESAFPLGSSDGNLTGFTAQELLAPAHGAPEFQG